MLKSPILRPKPLAKLENKAWRLSTVNHAPSPTMELVWWRPCHCHHRQVSVCSRHLCWRCCHHWPGKQNAAVSQASPGFAWVRHSNSFFTPTGFPFEVWWVHLIGSDSVLCPRLNWMGGWESVQPSSASTAGGRHCVLQSRKRVQRLGSLQGCPMPTLAGQNSSAEEKSPWGFAGENGRSEALWTRKALPRRWDLIKTWRTRKPVGLSRDRIRNAREMAWH